MIDVDISNIWSCVSLPELLAVEAEVSEAHYQLPPVKLPGDLGPILEAAKRIRENSQVLVVIGAGEEFRFAQSALGLLREPEGLEVLFGGDSLSSRQHQALLRQLEGKDFSLCIMEAQGDNLGPAVALRNLRWLLERRYGTDEARKRIYVFPAEPQSALTQWETLPDQGSDLTAPLLPLAASGVDVAAILRGAEAAKAEFDLRSFENPLWLYVASRSLLHRKGCAAELLVCSESEGYGLGRWWQRCFRNAGPLPVAMTSTDSGMGTGWFETHLSFDAPELPVNVAAHVSDLEGLKEIAGLSLETVAEMQREQHVQLCDDRGLPVVAIRGGALNAQKLGKLFVFFKLSSGLSRLILDEKGN